MKLIIFDGGHDVLLAGLVRLTDATTCPMKGKRLQSRLLHYLQHGLALNAFSARAICHAGEFALGLQARRILLIC